MKLSATFLEDTRSTSASYEKKNTLSNSVENTELFFNLKNSTVNK